MPFLLSQNEDGVDQRINLNDDVVTIGRHPDCGIVIDDPSVSRKHAQVVQQNGKYLIEDLKSRNGTFLNRRMIQQSTRLLSGDQIRICDALFTFYQDESVSVAPQRATIENTQSDFGSSILLEADDGSELSSIRSKMDISSHHGHAKMVASPEAKLEALMEITQALGKTIALDTVLPRVLECLFGLFQQADRGFIVMSDESGNLKPLAMKLRREDDEATIRISRTIVRHVVDNKQAIISTDAAADERFDLSQSISDFRIRSMMCAPLFDSDGRSVGVIQLDSMSNSVGFQNEDLDILAAVALQASTAIEKANRHREELVQAELIRDLELAQQIQRGLLPMRAPDVEAYDLYDYYQPAERVGGDYYDYIQLKGNRLAILVGDVVGHGVAAALLMAKVSAEARFALASLETAQESMAQLNRAISDLQLDRFVTIILLMLDLNSNTVTIVNAGHMPPVILRADGSADALSSDQSGLPVGILEDTDYEEFTIELNTGEMLALYTDGINEAQNPDGELFGNQRVIDLMGEQKWETPGAFGSALVTSLRQHLAGAKQDDDVCFVCLARR
ncbi:MAG: SpoIIE family protein phosphatase [Pirellulaceae bacterium]